MFSVEEMEYVKKGVKKFGANNWEAILEEYPFHPKRTAADIRRKWFNIKDVSVYTRIAFSSEEEQYLKEGVKKFGVGCWMEILRTYPFHPKRSNVDLKDKWRNLQGRNY